jgi:RHS repeat-associated protein
MFLNNIREYFPFGTTLREWQPWDERYAFQGQEHDEETGYDYFKYRMYDAEVARFGGVDPLRGKYPFYSSFSFSGNKVVAHIELEGLEDVYYLGAFSDGGFSTLPEIVNQTTEMQKGMEMYRSSENVGYNTLIVDGITSIGSYGRTPNGETISVPHSAIQSYINSGYNSDIGIGRYFAAALIDISNPGMKEALLETVAMGNDLSLVVIRRSDVLKAESEGLDRVLHRGSTALTIIHEFLLHSLDHALGIDRGQAAAHRDFYAPRGSDGNILPEFEGYNWNFSFDYSMILKDSRAWHIKNEIESILKQ